MKAVLSPATVEDIREVLRLDRACALPVWTSRSYEQFMKRPEIDFVVAAAVSRHPLFGFYLGQRAGRELEILKIGVDPRCRGQGIGRALLKAALGAGREAGCEECFLEVRSSNREAIDFYAKAGFVQVGRRKGYYTRPVEAGLIMRRQLV